MNFFLFLSNSFFLSFIHSVLFQIFFEAALALSLPGSDPQLGVEESGPETEGCFPVPCEGGGRWSSRLVAERAGVLGSSPGPGRRPGTGEAQHQRL